MNHWGMKQLKFGLFFILMFFLSQCKPDNEVLTPSTRYEKLQQNLSNGWNTWDTYHIMNYVLLPQKISVSLSLVDADGKRVDKCQIGDRTAGNPLIIPGERTFDGKYTELSVMWNEHKLNIHTSSDGINNIILITPLGGNRQGMKVIVCPNKIWDSKAVVSVTDNVFSFSESDPESDFQLQGDVSGNIISTNNNEISVSADEPILICIGKKISLNDAKEKISQGKTELKNYKDSNTEGYRECFDAMQSVLAWDNIYSDELEKVITPVSRIWNSQRGGYVLFCWDAYFASMMLSHLNKELAYANIVEITNAQTPQGFIPNRVQSGNKYSYDHSQPPVGSLALWHIYQKYGDKWLLELLFDKLMKWNRWWYSTRNWDGLMCWGSNPYESNHKEWYPIPSRLASSLESGMDNTHMYDDVDFDMTRNLLCLQDVGLTSLYVMDCHNLALIAKELNRMSEYSELTERADMFSKNIQKLWCEEDGMFYNRDPRNGEFNKRTSPTNFYVMLAGAATQEQAKRIVNEHMLNPDEFGGDWLLPATPRNDPAFKDNNYWRGRIWAPLNFLVYLGMKNYDLPEETEKLVINSKELLMKGWREGRYVFENYNSVSGDGDDVRNSDKFYHWGALLGYMSILENLK